MATAPPPGGSRPDKEPTITIGVDGETYVCRPGEVTAKQAADLRRQSGLSVRAVMAAASDDPDLDTIAALVWLARRQSGEYVTWDEVAESITYLSEIGSGDAPAEDLSSPET